MIRLEHVNLVVRDIDAMVRFYQAALPHWRIRGAGEDQWQGKPRRWLHLGDDYNYLTFNDNGEGTNRDLAGHSVGLAHFAYVVDDLASVIARLQAGGYAIAKPGAEDRYRQNVYFVDPAGFEVEFVQYCSDLPEQRNRYSD
ncbi:VOC family protein [Ferrimonas pelagia]|uniref:VOC family protein n=1 Tax=Ferrimonas pelagia TaxID=1177826 RepID=A0ABP9ENN0_9GAMM